MFYFFIFFSNCKLFVFNNTLVSKGFHLQKSIDSIGLSFISNISISNCSKNKDCRLHIIYYRNNDTSKIFFNNSQNKLLDVCCDAQNAKQNNCDLNSIYVQKNSPYTHVEYLQSDSMKFVTVPSITEAIWSAYITACVDDETSFTINGYVDYKPIFSTYIDERIKKISSFCFVSFAFSLIFIICYIIAQNKFNTQIVNMQSSFYILVICSCISDLFIYIFFDFFNKNDVSLFYLFFYSSLFRTISRVLLLKITYDCLLFPNTISVLITTPLLCTFSVSFFFELMGVHQITSRITGDWFFGYGNTLTSLALFLSNILVIVYILHCIKTKKEITNTRKRRKCVFFIIINLLIYIILTLLCVLIRRSSTLYFTRNIEVFTFAVEPLYFTVLMIIISWFLFIFNPQGFEPITADQNDDNGNSLGVAIDNMSNKSPLVGNAYALPSNMLNKKPEFALDVIEEEEEVKENI